MPPALAGKFLQQVLAATGIPRDRRCGAWGV